MKEIGMDDIINCELYEDCLVRDIVHEKGAIFSLIKKYKWNFSDEVLKEAHIKKIVRYC